MIEENITHFKTNRYCVVKSSVDQTILDIITQYALFDEIQHFNSEKSQGRQQVPNAHSIYADPAMESMLLFLQDVIEKNTGLDLYPTYSYYRIYRKGDELKEHRDRPSCEISATLCFNYEYADNNFSWPIYMDGVRIDQSPGDMVIYRGCELTHYREKMNIEDENSWQVQGFFHYVDANGPYRDWKYDKRENIGFLTRNQNHNQEKIKKYINYTK